MVKGDSTPCSCTMQVSRAPGETSGLYGAHLTATKANQREKKKKNRSCPQCSSWAWVDLSLHVAEVWLLSPAHLPGATVLTPPGAATAAAPSFSSLSSCTAAKALVQSVKAANVCQTSQM